MLSTSPQLRSELEDTVRVLLHEPEQKALDHVAKLKEVLMRTVEGELSIRKTDLPSGEAVSPYVAMLCLNGEKRTLAFLRGNYAAIKDRIEEIGDRPVYVLDAGCGPLSALSLPLATQFPSDRVRFIATDIHEESIRQTQISARKLSLYDHFEKFIITDLTTYQHQGVPLDVITSETMGAGLLEEPQSKITANLTPQLEEGGIWTPERIVVRAYLCGEDSEEIYDLGDVFHLTGNEISQRVSADLDLPKLEQNVHLYLGTRIIVYGDHSIPEGESTITMPIKVPSGAIDSECNKLHLSYDLGVAKEDISVETSHSDPHF